MTKLIKLAIDARPLTRNHSGIQRYLSRLLPALAGSGQFEIILYIDEPLSELKVQSDKAIAVRYMDAGRFRFVQWQTNVARWLSADKPDVYWSPRHHLPLFMPGKIKAIVTIHDFVWKTVPQTMPRAQLWSEQIQMPRAIKRADHLVCVSQTTANRLNKYFPEHAHKSIVILNSLTRPDATEFAPSSRHGEYFLCVGTLEPRKNYVRLLQAFDLYMINGGNKDLIIAGNNGWQFKQIIDAWKSMRNKDRVEIKQGVDDAELNSLYASAHAFISLSLDEGFGLPADEARQHGTPLLLSDIEIYRELYGDECRFVDPTNIESIAKCLHELQEASSTSPIPNLQAIHRLQDSSEQFIQCVNGCLNDS